ncbi:tellurite resistance TerB family protein [Moorena sp. SIO3A2]|uniref:tellurite resistance TerB family protein n=1 Tax=Moorena sp. SIO3A2 TaxID=2607841 RepID=UPI0013B6EE83|nr:tellurite resistance TerB family protein [Moorena sp. SIO3A2]NER91181.1 tellurite resistance TerB family protein [Moorena sp. SIO3A2]
MGLFDKISISRQHSQTTLGPAEAFAAIALIAVAADGFAASSEVQAIITALSRMQLFRSYSADVMARMFERLLMLLQRQGSEPLLSAALKSLPYELQATAFAIATDLTLADGEVTDEEEEFLKELYHALEISEETAIKIIDVMLIKNQG